MIKKYIKLESIALAGIVIICSVVLTGCETTAVVRTGRHYRRPPRHRIIVLPPGHVPVIISGKTRYYHKGAYYEKVPSGYIIVPKPQSKVYIFNVENSDGTITQVKLIRRGSGYLGPQGEYYPEFPTVEQLRAMYGK